MPANLTPQYQKAENAYRRATTAEERISEVEAVWVAEKLFAKALAAMSEAKTTRIEFSPNSVTPEGEKELWGAFGRQFGSDRFRARMQELCSGRGFSAEFKAATAVQWTPSCLTIG